MTAREVALACHDILATIFDHLAPTESDGLETTEKSRRSCRKALVASAVVCTTLSHHALNVLWRELESVHPLLRTLPNCKRVRSQITLSGAILDESWARFQLYADRVRSIVGSLESYLLDPIHPSVWIFLSAKCKGSPLIPRLHDLVAMDLRLSNTYPLVLLLSPSLRTLDLVFALEEEDEDDPIAPHVVRSLLETLPLTAPNLERFYCYIDISLDGNHGCIGTFRQFARLKTLSVSSQLPLDEDALRVLSAIPTLRDLSCYFDVSSSSALILRPCTFQDLTDLYISGPFDDLTAFMYACQFPSLARITLQIEDPPDTGKPVDSFAAISRRCSPALLTSFTATINYTFTQICLLPSCLTQYVEPLLAFPNIKFFHVSFTHGVPSLYDHDLARFGAAWPRLSSFHLSHGRQLGTMSAPEAARPTLAGLVDLARRCPQLESFCAPSLDVTDVPGENSDAAGLPLSHGLRTLSLNNAVLPPHESPAYLDAAKVLSRVFPSIDLEGARSIARSNGAEWEKFLRVVEEIRLQVGSGHASAAYVHVQASGPG